ncbi:MAG TPA: ATP-binding protein [Candidatus Dormibacteraeota bacterium]|nr:ATP-binding protein [Candidatus Dormibacteraeota bacterium]
MDTLTQAAHRRHEVRLQEDVGALRRAVAEMASGRPGVRRADVELVATELATNLVRHTSAGGCVLYRPAGDGIELLAVDEGPGLRTEGAFPAPHQGLGVGLGVIERLATTFDIYSTERGTVVLARLGSRGRRSPPSFYWGAVNVPLGGGGVSGDGWSVAVENMTVAVLLVDGLGHGEGAHEVTRTALSVFCQQPPTDLRDFVRRVHAAIGVTRGAVLGVCTIDAAEDRLTYAGVGNITGRVLIGGASRSLLSREGTLGTEVKGPTVDVVRDDWAPGAILVLASDGLRSQWDPRAYPGLVEHDPSVVAATLYRDHRRATDDATVLCVKDVRGGPG